MQQEAPDRFYNIKHLLNSKTDLAPDSFSKGKEKSIQRNNDRYFNKKKVLIIGAGGLGVELVRNCAMVGIKHITLCDMDQIDLTNLNRQFLFRHADIGKYKAEVAAAFVKKLIPSCQIVARNCPIQELSDEELKSHHLWISGLDSAKVRKWVNDKVIELIEYDNEGLPNTASIIPFIDGGTEGMRGQMKFHYPHFTGCYNCHRKDLGATPHFAMCTVAHNPRIPEHCIQYAMLTAWPGTFGRDKKYDTDSKEDITFLYEKALEKANEFGITGVTYDLTLGVVKHIIPIVASTNAVISAVEVQECIKFFTFCSDRDWEKGFNYNQMFGMKADFKGNSIDSDCKTCQIKYRTIIFKKTMLLQEVCDLLAQDVNSDWLAKDNLRAFCGTNGIHAVGSFASDHEEKLQKTVEENIADGVIAPGWIITATFKEDPYSDSYNWKATWE